MVVGECLSICKTIMTSDLVLSHLCYVFQYSKNIQELETETEYLENEWGMINEMVKSEERNAKLVRSGVEKWLASVTEKKKEIEEFLRDEQIQDTRCFICGCPNICRRYQLGKNSKSLTESVTKLRNEGGKLIKRRVAHSPPLPELPSAPKHWNSRHHIFTGIMDALKNPHIKLVGVHGADGCKVVVTSRRQDVFRNIKQNSVDQVDRRVIKEFRVDVLTEEEAWALFMKTAEISDDSEMPPEADVLCRECRGLPVAILAVAGALKGKEMPSWKDAVEQLKNSKLDGIVDIDQTRFSDLTLFFSLRSQRILRLSNIITLEDKFMVLMNKAEVVCLNGLEDLRKGLHERDGMIFSELKYLEIQNCNFVEHIFGRPIMFQPTPRQGSFDCVEIEEIVINEGQEDDGALIFPKLEEMQLENLPNFRSFRSSMRETSIKNADNSNPAQPLFSETVEFPSLRTLRLRELKDLREVCHDRDGMVFPKLKQLTIWDCNNVEHIFGKQKMSQPTPRQGSFGNLSSLYVDGCKVKYLFPLSVARCLVKLQRLLIWDCAEIEEIVINVGQEDDGALIFPKLEEMQLKKLPNLRSFRSSMRETSIKNADNSNPEQPLFSETVVFIEHCNNVERIFGGPIMFQPTPRQGSFGNLSSLFVDDCKVKYLCPLSVARCLIKLERLEISNCAAIEEIVINEGQGDNRKLIFPKLEHMQLRNLPNLRSFRSGMRETSIKNADNSNPAQPLFSETVEFPSLRTLCLRELKDLREVCHDRDGMIFPELKHLTIRKCNFVEHIFRRPKMLQPTPWQGSFGNLSTLVVAHYKVKYLFPLSVARCLVKLERLKINNCTAMEEIVINEGQGDDGELIFPKLEHMQLQNLPNLRSFRSSIREASIKNTDNSNPAQPLFSETVVFPNLSRLSLIGLKDLREVCHDRDGMVFSELNICYGIKLPSSVRWKIIKCPSFLRTEEVLGGQTEGEGQLIGGSGGAVEERGERVGTGEIGVGRTRNVGGVGITRSSWNLMGRS
ncbi:hypothetical protein U1Q18_001287 [Sarracenia purpurea var. burkii]